MRLALIIGLLATPASATGAAEWDAFRAEVAAACLALAPQNAAVTVSPFGSETYGAALISSIPAGVLEQQVCIYDKATRRAELASPFAPGS